MTERKSLESERAELVRVADDLDSFVHDLREEGNSDATAAWLEKRVTALRSLAAQDQKPIGYGYSAEIQSAPGDLLHVCRKKKALYDTPLYLSPPPAAGWDEFKPTQEQINSACMSYRHDFGLLDQDMKRSLRAQAREWLHVWQKEYAYALRHKAPPDSGAGKSASHYHSVWDALENAPHRLPDHGGADAGVRKALQELRDANMSYSLVSNAKNARRLEQAMRDADRALSKPAPVAANASGVLQNDLGEMLRALGMSDAAQPKSPHDVFQSALAEMKRQIANASAELELNWQLSEETKARIADINDNLRNAALNASNIVAGSTNASAEARLRDALARGLIGDRSEPDGYWIDIKFQTQKDMWEARSAIKAWRVGTVKALSAHPHASDCDNLKECCDLAAKEPCPDCPYPVTVCVSTKSEGGVEGHAIPRTTSATTTRYPATEGEENMVAPARRTEEQSSTKTGQAGIEPGPSERTADVALGELEKVINSTILGGGKRIARAILNAFTVGRR